ncbi:TIGR03621 family F420-dependent LLM class oxidoreductase [Mangrovihabitans endophyticus]|uniref:LLM class F420-dependent oxidoreductase n=1 Tax=Mangrovihabitans endophyticus TaxID=1751298 RepID=A0A8J3BWZ1_9ACTN|nr:TIGR03621 family F420-dependent LLM class oxidoreductase [Mangrovihabitans endophyticus]GGK79013.1 LLM class F420-dependent oxidoreductase [Mangrovihabitans endophyticus]
MRECALTKPFRFGAILAGTDDRGVWQQRCRLVEQLGYDTINVADHVSGHAPLLALTAAAAVTERVRLGTYVLNTALHPPGLTARDVLTAHRLSGGRLEAGLGAGYDKADFVRAGVPRPPFGERVTRLADTAAALAGSGAGRPEILVGGGGLRVLGVAAQHGDILAFSGAAPQPLGTPGRQSLLGPGELAERVRLATNTQGRAAELERNLMVQKVLVTGDRRTAAQALHHRFPHLGVDDLLCLPTLLIGTVDQIADDLVEHRRRYGFSYLSVPGQFAAAFAPVVKLLSGR